MIIKKLACRLIGGRGGKKNNIRRGFTFIELLVVIVAIGVLAGLIIFFMNGEKMKTRDAKRRTDLEQMMNAQSFYTANYPTCRLSAVFPPDIAELMIKTPADPLNDGTVCGTDHVYCALDNTASGDNQKFCYYAKLEDGGFFAVSRAGSFKKTAAPQNFDDCATQD
jgi:prepilin-type N-terminal cleavage/methylation domain-containing protein